MNFNSIFSNVSKSTTYPESAAHADKSTLNALSGHGKRLGGDPNISRLSGVIPKNQALGQRIPPQNSLSLQEQAPGWNAVAFSAGAQFGEVIGTALAPDNTGAAILEANQAVSEVETRVGHRDISVGNIFARTHGST